MKHKNLAARVSLWVTRAICALLAVLVFVMPGIISWYSGLRPLVVEASTALLTAFYVCIVPVVLALWQLDRLLRNILRGEIFVSSNVRCIQMIRWCCLAVALICVPASLFYPPLVFLSVIMGFLGLVVTVLCQVMAAAVVIREENDLTV